MYNQLESDNPPLTTLNISPPNSTISTCPITMTSNVEKNTLLRPMSWNAEWPLWNERALNKFQQKDNTELAEAVNQTLQQMRESGKLSELSEQWFGLDATNPPE